jgi:hypothetical protein
MQPEPQVGELQQALQVQELQQVLVLPRERLQLVLIQLEELCSDQIEQ